VPGQVPGVGKTTGTGESEMSAWSNLPNAGYIDRVLTHAKANPDKWAEARVAVRFKVYSAIRNTARGDAVWDVVWDAARGDAVWDAVLDAAQGAVRIEVWDACLALIAWDEAGELMGKTPQQLIALSDKGVHAATLLLPASIAMAETGGDE